MLTKLQQDITDAMKAKDSVVLLVLRSLKSAITDATKVKNNVELTVLDIINIVRKQIKQREDSMEAYLSAERKDLYDKEHAELNILQKYLPTTLTFEEVEDLIRDVIISIGARSKKDMGKVIKEAVVLAAGRIDNKTISKRVGELLP